MTQYGAWPGYESANYHLPINTICIVGVNNGSLPERIDLGGERVVPGAVYDLDTAELLRYIYLPTGILLPLRLFDTREEVIRYAQQVIDQGIEPVVVNGHHERFLSHVIMIAIAIFIAITLYAIWYYNTLGV